MMTTKQIEAAVLAAEQKDKELWDALQVAEKEAEALVRAPRSAWHQQRQNVDVMKAMLEVIHELGGEPVVVPTTSTNTEPV